MGVDGREDDGVDTGDGDVDTGDVGVVDEGVDIGVDVGVDEDRVGIITLSIDFVAFLVVFSIDLVAFLNMLTIYIYIY